MNSGRLAGSNKFVILPVNQGLERGSACIASDPAGHDLRYHVPCQLALDAGCNAYAALPGFLEENKQTALGGGFGTIVGRNSLERPHNDAVKLLQQVMEIHANTWPRKSAP